MNHVRLSWMTCKKSACLQKCFCSCNMNGLSCTDKCQIPHKHSRNDAVGGNDNDDDKDEDPSEI